MAQVIEDMLGESYRIQTDGKTYLNGFCFLILGEIIGFIQRGKRRKSWRTSRNWKAILLGFGARLYIHSLESRKGAEKERAD